MSDPTLHGTMLKDDNGFPTNVGNYAHITSTAGALIKTGPGFLYSITFNKPVATGTVELDDALTNTNPMGIITVPASPQPSTIIYNVAFQTGLFIIVGTAAQDLTISYR